jgi:hypothetical protein
MSRAREITKMDQVNQSPRNKALDPLVESYVQFRDAADHLRKAEQILRDQGKKIMPLMVVRQNVEQYEHQAWGDLVGKIAELASHLDPQKVEAYLAYMARAKGDHEDEDQGTEGQKASRSEAARKGPASTQVDQQGEDKTGDLY